MRVACVESPGRLSIRDVPMPAPKPWEALVRIDACSICNGTDTKILHGKLPGMGKYPVVPGHESTGIVVEVGSAVKHYRVGDRVLRPSVDPPGMLSLWGAFAEYGLIRHKEDFLAANPGGDTDWRWAMRQVVPPGIPADEATILITLKETYSWLKRFQVGPESRVLVLGAGPVSLCYVYWARFFGSRMVVVAARTSEARSRALAFGAEATVDLSAADLRSQAMEITDGKGFDRIVDAVGNNELLARSIQMLSPRGWVGIYGIEDATPEGMADICLPRGGDYVVMNYGPDEAGAHDEVMALMAEDKVRPADFITHRLPFEEIEKGFELVASRQAVKVVLHF